MDEKELLNMRKSINITKKRIFDENVYDYVKNAGFDGCDISLENIEEMCSENWETYIYRIKELLNSHNLECCQVHLPYHDLFVSSEIIQEDVKMAMLRAIKAMKILDCKWGAYHPRTAFNNNCNSDISIKDNYNEISIYLEEAEKYNVGIAVENIPIFPDCPQHRFFSADYDELNYLVESFKSEKVGICWDFGHANLMPIKQEKAFKILGDKIRIVHIHNNYRFCDSHVVPTLGTIDWESVMPSLKKCGYNGDFSLEVNYFNMDTELKSYFVHGYDSLGMLEQYFNSSK